MMKIPIATRHGAAVITSAHDDNANQLFDRQTIGPNFSDDGDPSDNFGIAPEDMKILQALPPDKAAEFLRNMALESSTDHGIARAIALGKYLGIGSPFGRQNGPPPSAINGAVIGPRGKPVPLRRSPDYVGGILEQPTTQRRSFGILGGQ